MGFLFAALAFLAVIIIVANLVRRFSGPPPLYYDEPVMVDPVADMATDIAIGAGITAAAVAAEMALDSQQPPMDAPYDPGTYDSGSFDSGGFDAGGSDF